MQKIWLLMVSDTTHTRQNEEQTIPLTYFLVQVYAGCLVTHTAISSFCQRKKNIWRLQNFYTAWSSKNWTGRKIWTKISRISINVFLQKLLVAARYQVAWIFKNVQIGSKWPFKFDITTRYDTPPKQVEVMPISAHFCLKNEFIRKEIRKNLLLWLLTRMKFKIERWNKINCKQKYDPLSW